VVVDDGAAADDALVDTLEQVAAYTTIVVLSRGS